MNVSFWRPLTPIRLSRRRRTYGSSVRESRTGAAGIIGTTGIIGTIAGIIGEIRRPVPRPAFFLPIDQRLAAVDSLC